jgi:hypothetical protein
MALSFTAVYVITSDGRDAFADMVLVSMLSVRISNPSLQIMAVCDEQSAISIKASKHRLLDVCDEFISVKTPNGEPTFRNRWIKTQLCNFVSGPALYLDVDTLVREDVSGISELVINIGFAPNNNGRTISEQLWDKDKQNLDLHGWAAELKFYPNGGVFFYNPTNESISLFKTWHRLWLEDYFKTGRGRDQPALYAAISGTQIFVTKLPAEYNWPAACSSSNLNLAKILHFYPNPSWIETIFGKLLESEKYVSFSTFNKYVANAISKPYEWPNRDFFARLIKKIKKSDNFSVSDKLWLLGRKKCFVRYKLSEAMSIVRSQKIL